MSSGFADLNGGRYYYDDAGAGSAIILIPGFTLDVRMWHSQLEALAAHHRVIRFDLPGSGKSPAPAKPYSYHDDLKSLLHYLEIDKAHIVGLSLGGAIALDFALAYPSCLISLAPVNASAVGGFPWSPELGNLFAAISAAAEGGDIAGAKELWLSSDWFAPASKKPDVADNLRVILADYSGWHFHNKNPVQRIAPPAFERLEGISAPTLVIAGELDLPYYNLPVAESLARRIPGAHKVIIPDVGHMANMEDPEQFNDVLLSFISDIETRK